MGVQLEPEGDPMANGNDRYDNEGGGGGSFVIGLLAGTVLGAGLGMLFAPKSGSELRGQISDQAGKLSEQAGNLANQASDGVRRATETASSWAEKGADKGREIYEKGREAYDKSRDSVARGADQMSRDITDIASKAPSRNQA